MKTPYPHPLLFANLLLSFIMNATFLSLSGIATLASRIPRLDLVRISDATVPVHSMHERAVVFVAKGSKRVVIGENIFTNAADQFLIVSVEVPVIGEVTGATPAEPYLCMRLHLNVAVLRKRSSRQSWRTRALTGSPWGSPLAQ